MLNDGLGRTSLKWPILYQVGHKTVTQSINPFSRCSSGLVLCVPFNALTLIVGWQGQPAHTKTHMNHSLLTLIGMHPEQKLWI